MYGNKSMKLEFNVSFGTPKTSAGLQCSGWFLTSGTHRDGCLSVINRVKIMAAEKPWF